MDEVSVYECGWKCGESVGKWGKVWGKCGESMEKVWRKYVEIILSIKREWGGEFEGV